MNCPMPSHIKTGGGGVHSETHQMFSVHTTPGEVKNAAITGHFVFVFQENSVRAIMIVVTPLFSKSSVFKIFPVHTKTQSRCFQIPPV